MARDDFAKAIELYRAESAKPGPDAGRTHAAMIRAMLRADKIKDADVEAQTWVATAPNDVWAQVALEEVQWREGKPTEAIETIQKAAKIDRCNAQVHADFAQVQRMSGRRATASKELALARRLDPIDAEFEYAWMTLQPRSVQLAEVTASLQHASSLDDKERKSLERRKDSLSQPSSGLCTLPNADASTSIPYHGIREDPDSPVVWGLDVAFDGKTRRLEIDTGASGLTITKASAAALHLEPDEHFMMGGIGDESAVDTYVAKVHSIKIGSLVFQDCDVYVLNKMGEALGATDGLIGGDVFSHFLLTLDFPGQNLKLDPLPKIPNTADGPLTLETGVQTDQPVRDRYVDPSMASWTKFYRSGHDILLLVGLNSGPPHLFIMDTGAGLNSISPEAAREVGKVFKGSNVTVSGIQGEVKQTYTTGPIKLQFGHVVFPASGLIAMDTSKFGKGPGVEVSGFIGAPILHELTVSIDYRDNLVNFVYDPKRLSHCVAGVNIADCIQ
jgi:tetratricopeptide (TPR) repeat protein